jgi:heme oxygenase
MTTTDARPISQRFKEGCWDLHQTAEAGDFARKMISGTLGREAYVRMLEQSLAAMRPLDRALRNHRASVPALATLIDDAQLHEQYLEADLRYFGVDPAAVVPGPAAQALAARVAECERTDPLLLLGLHYVREGANNGNHFVAKRLRGALGLPERDGTRHLDPYGSSQRAVWDEFKRKLDEQAFTAAQKDALVETARSMFRAIIDLHHEADSAATVAH